MAAAAAGIGRESARTTAEPGIAIPSAAELLQATPTLSNCPDCGAALTVLRIIPGRSAEYWTMRCTSCSGIHLDIVKPAAG